MYPAVKYLAYASRRLLATLSLILMVVWSQALNAQTAKESLVEKAIAQVESLPRLHTLLAAHDGEPFIEYAAPGKSLNRPANIKSLSKLVISALVGIAIERNVMEGVEQPITELLADERIPDGADPRIHEIRMKHLLTMQAGLERTSGPYYAPWIASDDWIAYALTRPFVDEPGGRMLYSTGNTHLLSAALTDSSGRDTHTLASSWLGEPLDIRIPPWTRDPQGIYLGGNNMALSPRALLTFGELYRQGGIHDGERILSEDWIAASWTPYTRSEFNSDLYGYGWFITQLAEHIVYYGFGFGGQRLYVIPSLALTVVMTSDPTPPSPGQAYMQTLDDLVAEILIPDVEKSSLDKP
ncbi:serine hydrolase [Pistricoccus aurantiacus]|uniref:Serine hydrolase n=1 Tax=Pistricoccus aurantiacus TaxID=1883414 RepID=A0A5B8SM39_9GAMM|nr:serine hydrolase [Pistricoccus aurantiacus]QEA38212.1 serine hydrolase [Pistricoccus aurantiacus]